ncbi:hypothetical protein CDAR_496791 [Caerostris darwini]|uniref:Uncharacterized protein n=1 Tax=Caerostris darwini TaxID=1538125 RepID=A0AAV4U578_9ARAC|nr:hypothetical protein CDAR_496791 [Caerostris darwini]
MEFLNYNWVFIRLMHINCIKKLLEVLELPERNNWFIQQSRGTQASLCASSNVLVSGCLYLSWEALKRYGDKSIRGESLPFCELPQSVTDCRLDIFSGCISSYSWNFATYPVVNHPEVAFGTAALTSNVDACTQPPRPAPDLQNADPLSKKKGALQRRGGAADCELSLTSSCRLQASCKSSVRMGLTPFSFYVSIAPEKAFDPRELDLITRMRITLEVYTLEMDLIIQEWT